MYAHSYTVQSKGTMEYPTDAPQAQPAVTNMLMALSHSKSFWVILHLVFKYTWIARTMQAGIKWCLHTAQQFSTTCLSMVFLRKVGGTLKCGTTLSSRSCCLQVLSHNKIEELGFRM